MIKNLFFIILYWCCLLYANSTFAQQTSQWGDQHNGTFRNPVLPADFSDPDFIRVGNDYYGISSTLQEAPGMVVIHSKDLVNWEIISHVVNDISTLGEDLNYTKMSGYNQGIYAGSLRYHNNKYYVHFTTKATGWYVGIADKPEGPWEVSLMTDMEGKKLMGFGWDDNCPFWDEDGNAYIIASNFGRYEWCPRLFRMSTDGKQLLDGRIADKSENEKYLDIVGGYTTHPYRTTEANKIFKRNGYYYFYFSEVRKAHNIRPRIPVLLRSKNMYGPYELKELLHSHGKEVDKEPNQGSIIDSPDGTQWFFLTHHGTGDFSGRFLSVLPVTWVNDWPQTGIDSDNDGIGEMVWDMKKTINSHSNIKMQTSDDFSLPTLGLQWQWNHQPQKDKWSLTERPGYLRLHAFKPLQDSNFFKVGNTLGQRYYRSAVGVVTLKMDVLGMVNGQEAGAVHYDGGRSYASIGIAMVNGTKKIVFKQKDKQEVKCLDILSLPTKTTSIYFRTTINFEGKALFEYSLNNKKFIAAGTETQLSWASYRSSRLGMYSYNNLQNAGYVDVDWFNYIFSNQ